MCKPPKTQHFQSLCSLIATLCHCLLSPLLATLPATILATPCIAQSISTQTPNPFAQNIQPILVKYCVGCHNESEHESNLKLHNLQALKLGGDAGPAITPGSPEDSLILRRLLGTDLPKMPPDDSPQPSPDDIAKIKNWIKLGALGTDSPVSLKDKWNLIAKNNSTPHKAITASVPLGLNQAIVGKFAKLEVVDLHPNSNTISNWDFIGKISQIRLDRDAKRAAVAGGIPGLGGVVQILDLQNLNENLTTPQTPLTIEAHNDALYCAAIHPTHNWVATAGYDRTIRLWDYQSKTLLRTFEGHNGAVYDLDFDPSGQVLASASADETIKIWRVDSGQRLDTLGQGEAEQLKVRFLKSSSNNPSNIDIVATGADRRIRQWRLPSLHSPSVSPLIHSIFAHESTIHQLALSPDQNLACTAAHDGSIKLWNTQNWELIVDLTASKDLLTSVAWTTDASTLLWSTLSGELKSQNINQIVSDYQLNRSNPPAGQNSTMATKPIPINNDTPVIDEVDSAPRTIQSAQWLSLPVKVNGLLKKDDALHGGDWYAFDCEKGDALAISTFAARNASPLDSHLEITDKDANPILRTTLQAVRESYFTFRGKDSSTIDDFRLHRWEDMELNQWLYAGGEVVRLWLYPRGPDSGFKVYPGFGNRFTYFGTSPIAHALNEPAWIVRELQPDEKPISNGLPIFPIYYSNDDDPTRRGGKDSSIDFVAPYSGRFYIRLKDTRGLAGDDFKYALEITHPSPRLLLNVETKEITLRPNVGSEFVVSAERFDGLDEDIEIDFEQAPQGIQIAGPLRIEKGQLKAIGQIRPTTNLAELPKEFDITLVAKSKFGDQEIIAPQKQIIKIKVNEKPTMKLKLVGIDDPDDAPPINQLIIQPGQTISAKLVIERGDLNGDIAFGGDDSGRNLPHGCFVDNIGLSGLLIPAGQSTRQVFITAASIVQPQRRIFHLRGNVDGNPTSLPVELVVQ